MTATSHCSATEANLTPRAQRFRNWSESKIFSVCLLLRFARTFFGLCGFVLVRAFVIIFCIIALITIALFLRRFCGGCPRCPRCFCFFEGLCLCIICGFSHIFLGLAQRLPLRRESVGFCNVISDNNVVEDCAAFHLPHVEAGKTKVIIFVQIWTVCKFWIRDLPSLPYARVGGIGNTFCDPFTFEFRIINLRRLPFTIFIIIPFSWLFALSGNDALFINPICRLLVLWIHHHGIVNPICRLLVFGIGYVSGRQHLPIII
mmetsp:Transcript_29676/g.46337  ORF Transcript_29676/g.46337 Transcript_29676/m.46337 type:complete len:260 (+) Transcript_29676:105-884(+)